MQRHFQQSELSNFGFYENFGLLYVARARYRWWPLYGGKLTSFAGKRYIILGFKFNTVKDPRIPGAD